ncbi:MAG: hypothetical protein FJX74_21960 [Armatimonadetes bacterium]|nr:hypothetical protein [Armatimonadota bacterium]
MVGDEEVAWDEPGATYFVTACLKRRDLTDLARLSRAKLVIGALRFYDGQRYWRYDFTVMLDHVHASLQLIAQDGRTEPLCDILGSVKSWTARRIN